MYVCVFVRWLFHVQMDKVSSGRRQVRYFFLNSPHHRPELSSSSLAPRRAQWWYSGASLCSLWSCLQSCMFSLEAIDVDGSYSHPPLFSGGDPDGRLRLRAGALGCRYLGFGGFTHLWKGSTFHLSLLVFVIPWRTIHPSPWQCRMHNRAAFCTVITLHPDKLMSLKVTLAAWRLSWVT